MLQLELNFDTSVLTDVCPNCGFGERVDFAGDDKYTSGYFYVCDCGYSSGMQPTVSYENWREIVDGIFEARRAGRALTASNKIEYEKHYKVYSRCFDALAEKVKRRTGKPFVSLRDMFPDGRDWNAFAPKSQQKMFSLNSENLSLEYEDDRLWLEYVRLCHDYPYYSYQYDQSR